jgi:hypothetical protein
VWTGGEAQNERLGTDNLGFVVVVGGDEQSVFVAVNDEQAQSSRANFKLADSAFLLGTPTPALSTYRPGFLLDISRLVSSLVRLASCDAAYSFPITGEIKEQAPYSKNTRP